MTRLLAGRQMKNNDGLNEAQIALCLLFQFYGLASALQIKPMVRNTHTYTHTLHIQESLAGNITVASERHLNVA